MRHRDAVRGFTLVEVVVALVVLQVAVLATGSTLLLASRTLRGAVERERSVAALAWVHDSLSVARAVGAGRALVGRTVVEWRVAGGGMMTLETVVGTDTLRLEAVVRVGGQ